MMGSNDLRVGEDYLLGTSYQQHNCQTGRLDSISLGSSPGRVKILISNPTVLRTYPLVEKTSGDNLEDISFAEP